MNAFDHRLGMVQLDVIVGEIPEGGYTAGDKPVGKLLRRLAGDAKDGNVGLVFAAEGFDLTAVLYGYAVYNGADDVGVIVKHGAKLETRADKIDVCGKGASQIADADQNGFKLSVKTQNFTNFFTEK